MRQSLLLKRRGGSAIDHPESVATTWSMAFERVEQQNAAAADLLRLCAFLAPDAIPEALFSRGTSNLGPHLSSLAADPLLLDEAIAVLGAYSLVHRDAQTGTISFHRLVQAVLKEALGEEARRHWAELAVRAINAALPHEFLSKKTWQQWKELAAPSHEWLAEQKLGFQWLPHALHCTQLIQEKNITFPEAGQVLHWVGTFMMRHFRAPETADFLREALAWRKHHLGIVHLDTADSLEIGQEIQAAS